MNLQLQHTSKLNDTTDLVYITTDTDLKKAPLHKTELQFVQAEFKKDSNKEWVAINQYSRMVYIVRAASELNAANQERLRLVGSKIAAHTKGKKAETLLVQSDLKNNESWKSVVEGIALASYQFDKYYTAKDAKQGLRKIQIHAGTKTEVAHLQIVIDAVFKARTLVNEPVSYLTATQLSLEIEKMAEEAGFRFEYLNKKKIQSLKMGGLLGVNQGSTEPPTFNILEYKPAKPTNKKPIVFVGKGVVFDTGGSSLKTSVGMEKMKGDMAGAAAVATAIYAIAKAQLPVHVVGLIPATDNRLDANAIVPGDVLTTYSGKTVEVLNTDAEGRLILADALHYAKKYNPEVVIDLATLTGAAVMAIGEYGIIAMQKDADVYFDRLKQSGNQVFERLVELPLWDEYAELIKSSVADIKNIGGPVAGSITAGKFLEHFIDYPWIHLDLSNALLDKTTGYRTVGGTGAGTRLLFDFVLNYKKS